MVSMKDIAGRCNVSVATVSKALNNQSDISEETRKRICQIASDMGYYPNSAARALKTNRSIRVAEFRLFLEVHHGVARIVQRVIAAEQDAILRMLVEDGLEKIGLDERGTA